MEDNRFWNMLAAMVTNDLWWKIELIILLNHIYIFNECVVIAEYKTEIWRIED